MHVERIVNAPIMLKLSLFALTQASEAKGCKHFLNREKISGAQAAALLQGTLEGRQRRVEEIC